MSLEGSQVQIFTTNFKVEEPDELSDEMRLNNIQTQFIRDSQLIAEANEDERGLLDFTIKNDDKGVASQKQSLIEIDLHISHEEIVKMRNKMLLDRKNFTVLDSMQVIKKGKLASIHKATLKGEDCVCKLIKNERINNFIIEGFLEILCKLK